MDFGSDLTLLYSDFGVPVTYTPKLGGAAIAGMAMHRHPGMAVLGGDVIATDHTLRYSLSSFPSVKKGDSFQIGAVAYTVRENPQQLARGLEAVVPLARA